MFFTFFAAHLLSVHSSVVAQASLTKITCRTRLQSNLRRAKSNLDTLSEAHKKHWVYEILQHYIYSTTKNITMKINILSTGLFLLFILIIHTACQKEILIEQQPYDEKITIESLLEVGTLPKVYISKSVPFFDSDVNPVSLFLSDAKVILSQNGQEEVLKMDLIFELLVIFYIIEL